MHLIKDDDTSEMEILFPSYERDKVVGSMRL